MLDQPINSWLSEQHRVKLEARIMRKIAHRGACWEWTGSLTKGYGTTNIQGVKRSFYTHRIMYALKVGVIPAGLHVLHKCDNRRCCNPDHLFVGTNTDNVRDMISKGRHCHGERHRFSRMTDAQIAEATAMRAEGASIQSIADRFGVSIGTASRVVTGVSRKTAPVSAAIRDAAKSRGPVHHKMSLEKAREVRERYRIGGISQAAIGRLYGVTEMVINLIVHNKAWKDA